MSKAEEATDAPIDILILEGDGIGPEITKATLTVLEAAARTARLSFRFDHAEIGFKALRNSGSTIPDQVLAQARAATGIILGPVSHNEYPPVAEGGLNPSGLLRRRLDLYANVRPARSREGFPPRCGRPIDLVVVRENTEGFYADRSMFLGPGEFMPTSDVALAVRKITRSGSTRIAEEAFRLARQRRRKVTAVHKANVLRVSDGRTWPMRSALSMRWPRCWFATQASSTSYCRPTCMATSCPMKPRKSPAVLVSLLRSTPARIMPLLRRSTAPRLISQARTRPTLPR
jgi:3-isopropylmalate dehydrogenase